MLTLDQLAAGLLVELDKLARNVCRYEYGLPLHDTDAMVAIVRGYFADAVMVAMAEKEASG